MLALLSLSCTGSAFAKARLVVIYQLRSTPELANRASKFTQELATRIAAIDGYDAKIVASPPAGSLGAAAATAGAETYVVGQVVAYGDMHFDVKLGSFSAATDKSIKGHDLTIDTQKKLIAYVDHTVHIVSNTKSDLPANGGFAK
ncbi:MAG: hypothetical protein NVSMB5_25950 [Candidatus Velthaea sp.]